MSLETSTSGLVWLVQFFKISGPRFAVFEENCQMLLIFEIQFIYLLIHFNPLCPFFCSGSISFVIINHGVRHVTSTNRSL